MQPGFPFRFLGQAVYNRRVLDRQEHHLFVLYEITSDAAPILNEESESFHYFTAAELMLALKDSAEQFGKPLMYLLERFYPHLVNQQSVVDGGRMEPAQMYPKVGIGIMVFKYGKVLLGKRKGAHGEGEYAWPGGHMEYMESFEDCAKREVREEAGIEIDSIRFLRLLNFKTHAPKHYVDVALMAHWQSGEPEVREPDRCEGWDWYDLDNLPAPLFGTLPSYLEAYTTGRTFFDA